MNQILKLILPLILLLPGLTNAAVEEGECFGGPLTQNIIDQYTGADWYEDEPEIGEIFLYRGVFRALYHPPRKCCDGRPRPSIGLPSHCFRNYL